MAQRNALSRDGRGGSGRPFRGLGGAGYEVGFVDAQGNTITAHLTRTKSCEAVPFLVRYHLELPGGVPGVTDDLY